MQPRRATSGATAASSSRAAAITSAWAAVGSGSVRAREMRVKSSKRTCSVSVRPVRASARIRRVTRSASASRTASSAAAPCGPRPSACCDPKLRRRGGGRTARTSRWCAAAWRWPPAARPRMAIRSASLRAAASATVRIPRACSFRAVFSPTPQSASTASGCRKAVSSARASSSSPSGFAARLAIFASSRVRATPTVTARPTARRTSRRSRAAIARGEPEIRSSPRTSRNASSSESPSTSGAVRSNTANSARLASTYASKRAGTTTASGQRRRARAPCMPPWTPRARAS